MSLKNRTRLGLESLDDRIVPAVVDLTAAGSEGLVNSAIVHRIDSTWNTANGDQAHGRGQLRTVLTVAADGVEQGYNTNYRPIQAGMNSSAVATETRSLRVDRVPVVTVAGTQYYEFVLNVNEPTPGRRISVDELRFYVSDRGNLRNYNESTFTLGQGASLVSPVYDLDAGDATNSLAVRAKVNTSAVGEIAVLVPVSNFGGAAGDMFVYIYTKMSGAGGDAEQWGVRNDPPVTVTTASLSGQIFLNDTQTNWTGAAGTFTVYLDGDNGNYEAVVDENGVFTFTNVAAGIYSLSFADTFDFPAIADPVIGQGDGNSDGEYSSFTQLVNIDLSSGEVGLGYGFIVGTTGS